MDQPERTITVRITDVKTHVVGNPWKNWVFVQISTDEGLTGLGEATGSLATMPHQADVEELKHVVLGEDPCHPERLFLKMVKARFFERSVGIAAIEQACWDILGKSLNAPLWRLFGGQHHPRLRVYANGWYRGPRDPGFFAERACEMVEKGYTALKFDPFGGAYKLIEPDSERLAVAIVAAIREAVGDEVDLLVEAHDRFTVSTAIRIGQQLEPYRPFWLETPVRSHDIEGTLAVQQALSYPVAVGEMLTEPRQFSDLLAHRVVDIIQPEPMSLGPSTTRKVFAVADVYDASVACHQAQSPFCTAMNAHHHCSIPNFLIQECFDDSLEPWTWDVLEGVPRVENGYLVPSDAPGWGVTLDEREAAKHPYHEGNRLRLFEEGWEKRRPTEGG